MNSISSAAGCGIGVNCCGFGINIKLYNLCLYRDACHDSWTNLRLSPMFGCICPNNHMKKRCDRIFNIVNHNPCVGKFSASNCNCNCNQIQQL